VSYTTYGLVFLFLFVLYCWWNLSRRIAEVEAKLPDLGSTGKDPDCCDDLEKRIDKIVVWLRKQFKFNHKIDTAICALEAMAKAKDFDAWDKEKSNCGHDSGGERVPPPEPDPDF